MHIRKNYLMIWIAFILLQSLCFTSVSVAQLPKELQMVIESRQKIVSGHIQARVSSNLMSPDEDLQSSIRNFKFLFDRDRLRIKMSEEVPMEKGKPCWNTS